VSLQQYFFANFQQCPLADVSALRSSLMKKIRSWTILKTSIKSERFLLASRDQKDQVYQVCLYMAKISIPERGGWSGVELFRACGCPCPLSFI